MKIKFETRTVENVDKEWCGMRVWKRPKFNHIYAIGVDVAEGVGRDASCAQVIDCVVGEVVANFWSNAIDTDDYAAQLFMMGKWYNMATLNIEANNHGHAVITHLSGASDNGLTYSNLYYRTVDDEFNRKQTKKIGFRTTRITKPKIIENLKAALRDGDLVVYDEHTVSELSGFVRDSKTGTMAAKGSAKDDRVMSLALAWEQARLSIDLARIQKQEEVLITEPRYDKMTGFPIF